MVILKSTNPKTKETMVLPSFKLPLSHKDLAIQPTAVEARHFAATFGLFRVCSMRNIHMMLPPIYRDLWKNEFRTLKAEDVQEGRGWMYEADPFMAKLEREEAQALNQKQRKEREKQKSNEANKTVNLGIGEGQSSTTSHGNAMKHWARVPKIEMGKNIRARVEELVRNNAVWNPRGVRMSEFQRRNVINELAALSFRKSHVEEAVLVCKDREETLEWLLIQVPEDDLPKWSLPEGYTAGISMASGNLKRESAVKRLSAAGYSFELCEKFFDENDGHEGRAAEALQNNLAEADHVANGSIAVSSTVSSGAASIWDEEKETLTAIYGHRFEATSSEIYNIILQVPCTRSNFTLNVRKSNFYPHTAPIISVLSQGLPAYVKLSIIRQAVEMVNAEYLGGPMIFNIVDWLENEIPRITENPGSLRGVSAGITGMREKSYAPSDKRSLHPQRRPGRVLGTVEDPQSIALLDRWRSKQKTTRHQTMLRGRQLLPAWGLRHDIITTVNDNQVTIISGETGSGKSTQAVQFIFDEMIQLKRGSAVNIICTQPRRISALGLADRVSDERCSLVGEEVGYAIRGESAHKPGVTKITFVTTGVLLRRLQTSGGTTDDVVASLADVSHVFVDEVHERSLDVDFLLILLRTIIEKRKDFKVVLMSATLDANTFEQYFNKVSTVGKVEIQGRTFPVEDYFLDDIIHLTGFDGTPPYSKAIVDDWDAEDGDSPGISSSLARTIQNIGMRINYDLIASTVRAIDSQLGSEEGGILIFLPGVLEINRTLDAIRGIPNIFGLPLHASLLPTEQRRVFPPPPKGQRKVIAATNVAETSITISDIVAVIDLGKVKETRFDPQNNMVKLEEVWASRAACKQRRGRAGRVKAGKCYKLYTRNAEAKMSERNEPEIRRVPLEQISLSIRAMGITDVRAFLASAITPPDSLAVESALDLLSRMGVLDSGSSELTALGRHLSLIPADLRCSKLMVYGATFGCLESTVTIAAILTVKSPFVSPHNKREEAKAARSAFGNGQGDLICDLYAFDEWDQVKTSPSSGYRSVKSWCDENFLSVNTLQDIASNRAQYLSSLKEAGFIPTTYSPPPPSVKMTNPALLRALIAAAFNPQYARIEFPEKKFAASVSGAVELDPEARTIRFYNEENGRVFVHPGSTLFGAQGFGEGTHFMSYFNKMETSKIFVRELTRNYPFFTQPLQPFFCFLFISVADAKIAFNPYTLLLFSGPLFLDTLGRGLIVDNWIRLRGWARIGVLVSRLRIMLDEALAKKIEDPRGWDFDQSQGQVVELVRSLVEWNGLDQ